MERVLRIGKCLATSRRHASRRFCEFDELSRRIGSAGRADWAGMSSSSDGVPSMSAGVKVLEDGFEAQASGRCNEAISAYRKIQRSRSPLLQALAANAEGLLLLRSPVPRFGHEVLPVEPCAAGDEVLAPWAEDGGEYPAVIRVVDAQRGVCTVDWEDGGQTHRVVPLASLTTSRGGVSTNAKDSNPTELRAWVARRTLHRALDAWEMQAKHGLAHDAFVDIVGLLCDTALAELRAVLASSSSQLLAEGILHARRHLQRARFISERAYAPDARALAVLCMHRAEFLRLSAAAPAASSSLDAARRTSVVSADSMQEVISLHERAAHHLNAAIWKNGEGRLGRYTFWSPPGGGLPREAVHEVLWAKALASQALASPGRSVGDVDRRRRPVVVARGRAPARAAPSRGARRRKVSLASRETWSLPEKLLPPTPGLPRAQDSLLDETCHARAALSRAWRALRISAGETASPASEIGSLWTTATPEEAVRLGNALGGGGANACLLLEVSVLTFALGCKLGRVQWARAVAAPLAHEAARRLRSAELTADDSDVAAIHTAEVLAGHLGPAAVGDHVSRATIVGMRRRAEQGCAVPTTAEEGSGSCRAPRGARWRLVAYRPLEELWMLRVGPRHVVNLLAPPPLTWCLEGLALSETAPTVQSEAQ